jgi:hypothetical protein
VGAPAGRGGDASDGRGRRGRGRPQRSEPRAGAAGGGWGGHGGRGQGWPRRGGGLQWRAGPVEAGGGVRLVLVEDTGDRREKEE